jgi:DNA-binding PadR family transcriptional regulator
MTTTTTEPALEATEEDEVIVCEVEESELDELSRKAAIYDTLVKQEKEVARLAEEWADAKSEAAAAKGVHDTAVAELRRLIRAQNESNPLFDDPEPEPEEWREVRLDSLDIGEKLLEKVHDAGLETIGAISDWIAKGNRLVNIAGVGPAASEKLEDALEHFWATQPPTADDNQEVNDEPAA